MNISHPFGAVETIALSATGSQAVTIQNGFTIIDGVTTQATGERTLVATIVANVKAGAVILVKTKTATTENTVFSTGFTAPTYAGESGKTFCNFLLYDGTTFKPMAVAYKID